MLELSVFQRLGLWRREGSRPLGVRGRVRGGFGVGRGCRGFGGGVRLGGGLETWWMNGFLERGKWGIGGEGMVFGLMCRNWVSFVRFGEGARGEVADREG